MRVPRDITGLKFGRLTALTRIGTRNGKARWRFRCACGRNVDRDLYEVFHNETASCRFCGVESRIKHGCARQKNTEPAYRIWLGMRQRCSNPKATGYQNYGGRGIRVCERWTSFEHFWTDMGPRPTSAHSIERKNSNGNYCPENCKWATKAEQSANQRHPVSTLDLRGQTFARLTAIRRVRKDRYGAWVWLFRCRCGQRTEATVTRVRLGQKKSCGCRMREYQRQSKRVPQKK